MFSMLWTIKFMLFFFAVLTTLFYVFLSIFIDDVYLHLALRFFMVYFCLLDVFLLCSVFFSYFFLFFFFFLVLLHSLSFFKKLCSICSWFSTTFYNSFIYSLINFSVATDPREPNYQYEVGNSFGDIYACFTSNKR